MRSVIKSLTWKLMHLAYRLRFYRLAEYLLNRFELRCDDPGSRATIYNVHIPKGF